MTKRVLLFISVCLIIVVLAGCGYSKSENRKNEIYKMLEESETDCNYTVTDNYGKYESNAFGNGEIMVGQQYLYSTGNAIYGITYVGEGDVCYNVVRHDLETGKESVVNTIPKDSEYNYNVYMIDQNCYYRYKVVEKYESFGNSLLNYPSSYEYHWYKFSFEGEVQSLDIMYPSDKEMTHDELTSMCKDFQEKMILSKVGKTKEDLLNSRGIMSKLAGLANENEYDEFTFTRICGYNPDNQGLIVHCYYHVNEGDGLFASGQKYSLELCFLINSEGTSYYMFDYTYKNLLGDSTPNIIAFD